MSETWGELQANEITDNKEESNLVRDDQVRPSDRLVQTTIRTLTEGEWVARETIRDIFKIDWWRFEIRDELAENLSEFLECTNGNGDDKSRTIQRDYLLMLDETKCVRVVLIWYQIKANVICPHLVWYQTKTNGICF